MSGCAAQTFSGVTQEHFNCLVQKASAAGIAISGNQGQASKDNITIRWNFDPVAGALEIQCTATPFFVSCSDVNGKIHDLVDACQNVSPVL